MEFYLICGLFITILLSTTACNVLQEKQRDEIRYKLTVKSDGDECFAQVEAEGDKGVDTRDQRVDSPVEIIEVIRGSQDN